MALPLHYEEKVYSGVLGKIIGVYLGRPFEGWTYERIMNELGPVNYYVHEKLNLPLIVTDDDISGTFTFLRALPDYGNRKELAAWQIGQTWLNYIIEEKTILWWGGLGNSTEHTAFLRLKGGIPAPQSGSIGLNTQVVAEQIGAQIFIDGWGMVAPGDPALAADLAKRAGSVSHDGEAVYGAQVIAAMEAQAFVENSLETCLDTAVRFIPKDSLIYRLIDDIRNCHADEANWHKARKYIADHYGYDKYGGNCHIIPNHALIIMALLYGDDDLQKSLMIVNTAGWDTDCNSGNVGCFLGIKNGLAGLETGPDWRGPIADQMFLPTADGGRAITDALQEAYRVINVGRSLNGMAPVTPKNGARFHFSLPGAVQGFRADNRPDSRGTLWLENVSYNQQRVLALHYQGVATGREARASTPTFIPQEYAHEKLHYELLASPTLYPGQIIRAHLIADSANSGPVQVSLFLRRYGANDELFIERGESVAFQPGDDRELTWTAPDLGGQPVAEIGVTVGSEKSASGTLYLDALTWEGNPKVRLGRPEEDGTLWRKAWVNAVDEYGWRYPEPYRIMQNHGTGLLIQGTREWKDYTASAELSPHMAKAFGLAVRVQGLERNYALEITSDQKVQLVKRLDGRKVLAEAEFAFAWDDEILFEIHVEGPTIRARVNGKLVFELRDMESPLLEGAVALVVEEGRLSCAEVRVE